MAYGTERAKEIGNVASIQNPGAIAGSASEGLQQYGSDIPRGMTGICSLNRRVRYRTHGGVGGGDREVFSYPDWAPTKSLPSSSIIPLGCSQLQFLGSIDTSYPRG